MSDHIREQPDGDILRLTKINTEARQGVSMSVLAGLSDAFDRVSV